MTLVCRFCNQPITPLDGRWIHRDSGSVYCDLSGQVQAVPSKDRV